MNLVAFAALSVMGLVSAARAQPQPPAAPPPAAPESTAPSSEAQAPSTAQPNEPAQPPESGEPHKDMTQEFLSDINLEKSLNLRDPFRRPKMGAAVGSEGGVVPDLERFGVDQFRLVGVITGMKRSKALITDPDGKIFIVSDGTRIGTRKGTVKRIAPGKVSVEERVVNILGQEEKVESVIIFKEKPKEGGEKL